MYIIIIYISYVQENSYMRKIVSSFFIYLFYLFLTGERKKEILIKTHTTKTEKMTADVLK